MRRTYGCVFYVYFIKGLKKKHGRTCMNNIHVMYSCMYHCVTLTPYIKVPYIVIASRHLYECLTINKGKF